CIDPAGARLISGATDSTIMMWDFPAMDVRLKSFRTLEPEADIIHKLTYSPSGDRFLMASSNSNVKVFDRDGRELLEFIQGYPYVSIQQTKGHIANVSV